MPRYAAQIGSTLTGLRRTHAADLGNVGLIAAVVGGVVAGLVANAGDYRDYFNYRFRTPPIANSADSGIPREIVEFEVVRTPLHARANGLHGYLFHKNFRQFPFQTGVSIDAAKVTFTEPVEILGIWVSLDVGSRLTLVEFAARVNGQLGYFEGSQYDYLIHTTYNQDFGMNGRLDEHIFFGESNAFLLDADDYLLIGAFLYNQSGSMEQVAAEILIYYNWTSGGGRTATEEQ